MTRILKTTFFPLLYSYLFVTLLPKIQATGIGIDPSWSYGISYASEKNFNFGEQIIFTYGPFGYLFAGAILDQNFWQIVLFRWLVYSLLFFITAYRIFTLESTFNKLLLACTILYALTVGTKYLGVGFSPDYQIIFCLIMIFSFGDLHKKYHISFAILLGLISGFLFLTKFTLGISCLGALELYFLGNLCTSFKIKSPIDSSRDRQDILNSILSAVTIIYLFLNPSNFPNNFNQILSLLLFSALVAGLLFFLRKKWPLTRLNFLTPLAAFYVSYSLVLTKEVLFSTSPSIPTFLKNSLDVATGYSSAMSIIGSQTQVQLAIFSCAISAYLFIRLLKLNRANIALPLLWILFLSFKQAFVRQDCHVIIFAITAPMIAILCLIDTRNFPLKKHHYILFALILATSIKISYPCCNFSSQLEKLTPINFTTNIHILQNLKSFKAKTLARIPAAISRNQLPAPVNYLIKDKPIEIIPWGTAYALANKLNWKPRPVFQSYAAYTKELDNLNANSLSTNPRDFILYQFASIDRRHPYFDEPNSNSYLLCNYQPSINFPTFIENNGRKTNTLLLERLSTPRCQTSSWSKESKTTWRTTIPISAADNDLSRISIKFKYSFFGKFLKFIFRSPPVYLHAIYKDGSRRTFRIIPENSENGIIVSHLPRNPNEALEIFQGKFPAKVSSIRLISKNNLMYEKDITFSLGQLRLDTNPSD